MNGQWRNRVFWGHRDGIHLFAFGWHVHAFVWTRGHRRNPFYFRAERDGDRVAIYRVHRLLYGRYLRGWPVGRFVAAVKRRLSR